MRKRPDVDMFEYFSDISRHAMVGREDSEIQDFLHPERLDDVIGGIGDEEFISDESDEGFDDGDDAIDDEYDDDDAIHYGDDENEDED